MGLFDIIGDTVVVIIVYDTEIKHLKSYRDSYINLN